MPRSSPTGAWTAAAVCQHKTVHHLDRLLHTALRDAVRGRLIAVNPVDEAKRPKVERTPKHPLSAEEFAALLAKAQGGRFHVPILIILAAGLRRGELLALRWRNTDLEAGVIFVLESVEETKPGLRVRDVKTNASRRRVDLPEFAVVALRGHQLQRKQEHLAPGLGWSPDTLVFGNPLGEVQRPRNFTKSVTRLAASASIRFTPHLGRHDHFTRLLKAGVHPKVAQVRAGHSSVSTRLDIYSHAYDALQREATERMDDAFREIQNRAGGNRVAKPLPSPSGQIVSV